MRTLNKQHALTFLGIIFLGISYLFAYFTSAPKLFSGFVMQLIFMLNSGVQNPVSSVFFINILGGLVFFYLSFLLVRGLISSLHRLIATQKELSKLSLINKKRYFTFESSKPTAFTAGLFRPQVYLSSALVKLCQPTEIKAILHHELQHQLNFDPLKDFIVRFILSITPAFPYKKNLFESYFTLTEVNCDSHACRQLSTPRPLISALYKIISFKPSLALNFFSANQNQRLKVLVNRQPLTLKKVFVTNFSLIAFFVISSFLISKSSLFFECRHLIACLNTLLQPSTSVQMIHSGQNCQVLQEISCQLTNL